MIRLTDNMKPDPGPSIVKDAKNQPFPPIPVPLGELNLPADPDAAISFGYPGPAPENIFRTKGDTYSGPGTGS